MENKYVKVPFIFIISFLLFTAAFSSLYTPAPAHAYALTDMVGEKVVRFYEEDIAGETFISNINPARKARMCENYGVNENKLNAVLILQDLGARVGIPQTASDLAKMTDKQLFSTGKTIITAYIDTLNDSQKSTLKDKFKSAISG